MHPRELVDLYRDGGNITSLLKDSFGVDQNVEEIIETAYDLQAGSYIKSLDDPAMLKHKTEYGAAIAKEILSLTTPGSILEAGIGEGTTFSFVLDRLGSLPLSAHGLDISWSRIAHCRDWLRNHGQNSTSLSTASLLHIPYCDDSFDVVYTSHTIEPNGGDEGSILKELYRVTSRFLVLLEPAYEFATKEARQRMDHHGYCRGLVKQAELLSMRVIKHALFSHCANPLNPTALIVIEKESAAAPAAPKLVCPRFGDPLIDHGDSLYSAASLRAYPKIRGIALLRPQDGIIASAYERFR